MKKICMIIGLGLFITIHAGLGISGDASAEKGKQLFNDQSLGGSTNDKSCNSCHADGQGLDEAGVKEELVQMINMCIERPLKGHALEENSLEMESLKLYIKSLE